MNKHVIVIASNNFHKIEELKTIMHGFKLVSAGSIISDFSPEEVGRSFLDNSLIKARSIYAHLQTPEKKAICMQQYGTIPPILADDSGIMVDALGGKPGIYSARFGRSKGTTLSSMEQNTLLLSMLKKHPRNSQRTARYICCMSLLLNEHKIITAQESWEGEIALEPSMGTTGFGYDPIFFLPERGCTAADISKEEKNLISHRGKATKIIISALLSLYQTPESTQPS